MVDHRSPVGGTPAARSDTIDSNPRLDSSGRDSRVPVKSCVKRVSKPSRDLLPAPARLPRDHGSPDSVAAYKGERDQKASPELGEREERVTLRGSADARAIEVMSSLLSPGSFKIRLLSIKCFKVSLGQLPCLPHPTPELMAPIQETIAERVTTSADVLKSLGKSLPRFMAIPVQMSPS